MGSLSITNAVLVIVTLVGMDVVLSRWRQRSRRCSTPSMTC